MSSPVLDHVYAALSPTVPEQDRPKLAARILRSVETYNVDYYFDAHKTQDVAMLDDDFFLGLDAAPNSLLRGNPFGLFIEAPPEEFAQTLADWFADMPAERRERLIALHRQHHTPA